MAAKESEIAQVPESSSKGGIVQTAIFAVGLFVLMILSQFLFEMLACKVAPGILPNCGVVSVSEDGEEIEEEEELLPPIYMPLDPPLVATFEDRSAVRFLQLTLEVMARNQEAIDAVQTHMPVIRNNLLLLMGGRTLTDLTSREGKEALRAEALEEVQRILTENTGDPGVEELYFTSFVVQ